MESLFFFLIIIVVVISNFIKFAKKRSAAKPPPAPSTARSWKQQVAGVLAEIRRELEKSASPQTHSRTDADQRSLWDAIAPAKYRPKKQADAHQPPIQATSAADQPPMAPSAGRRQTLIELHGHLEKEAEPPMQPHARPSGPPAIAVTLAGHEDRSAGPSNGKPSFYRQRQKIQHRLRQAVIWSEILDMPVGLRAPHAPCKRGCISSDS